MSDPRIMSAEFQRELSAAREVVEAAKGYMAWGAGTESGWADLKAVRSVSPHAALDSLRDALQRWEER